ncbi:hypothetical protein SIAM614_28656 [Stappia aggregata IAM 12614]|uniref:Uncharacterized protein n=1 Tax=Roseibium aggregatum (strain ATCC 25650 / DSM 13394 / JCM 20685 / NBRC 16684 / NCIMB 2208 / IAM 12614 / B1) TaxID=384765 RepID=A0P4B4_ROSAI|nr:hypothetical protein SIAM614_28656 [Stappia aggregata IAM 12614] [Roseibium aggregatum IAM 12614]
MQIDGSGHRWFEDRRDPCTLQLFINDPTSGLACGRVMARFQAQVVPRDVGARSDAFDTSNVFTSFEHEEPDVV